MTSESTEFQLGHPQSEHETLSVLSRTFQTFTRQQFAEAGLKDGMSVLEVGSGGDVALIAGEFVGRSGSVVGVEQSRDAVDYATHHAAVRGLHNVKFIEANIEQDLPFDTQFDALVGRVVLMFLPSPAVTLRRLARHVRPGGLVIFQEPDMSWAKSVPSVPSVEQAAEWMRAVFRASGANSEFGPKLHGIFKAAGLPAPQMRVDGRIYGSEGDGPALLTESIRAMLPALEQLKLATADEVSIQTLEDRIRVELGEADATMSSPLLVSAWARLPD